MLTLEEDKFYKHFLSLKEESGNHSPSVFQLLKSFPEVSIRVDACFLCNPYAFNIFYDKLQKTDLQKYVKLYPPQNREVAANIAAFRGIPAKRILVGNGAIEIIEHIIGGFTNINISFPLPTFSSYYESLNNTVSKYPYLLTASNGYKIDVDDYAKFIKDNHVDVAILVNPNNPTGTLVSRTDVIRLHQSLGPNQKLIVDESFIDFASEDASIEKYAVEHNNIIIIRSLSKDFGVAGLRVGYGVLPEDMVTEYLEKGFLWNSNGIAYFFTELLADKAFQKQYEKAKNDYNDARNIFYNELVNLGIEIIPSQANFFMIKTVKDPGIYFTQLLYSYGIYTRILNDKWGLQGNWLRIASKDKKENRQMIHAIKKIWKYENME